MADELDAFFRSLFLRFPEIIASVISDRDGVSVHKALKEPSSTVDALNSNFLAAAASITDQADKLNMGANQSILAVHDKLQIVHFSFSPLVVTLVATAAASSGTLLDLQPDIAAVAAPLAAAFASHS
eukprot:m.920141 g.920141  ORF g.920141 m.920141 type:complete len:127 (-) comp61451_c0_seq1:172-552(-)